MTSCPSPSVYNHDPFSFSKTEARYRQLQSNSISGTPATSVRIRKPESYKPQNSKYLKYSTLEENTKSIDGTRANSKEYSSTRKLENKMNGNQHNIPVNNPQFVANTKLNMLTQPFNEVSVFPQNIYRKYPFSNMSPYLTTPQDLELLYTFSPDINVNKQRHDHPLNSSRFGYRLFESGLEYGAGEQVFGYVEPKECHECANDTPKNMALPKFYSEHYLKHSPTELRKINGI